MAKKEKGLIKIDLDQFKLHIKIEHKIELSLHFDSPSRRFYLSVMAFVVNEMQKLGRITSIPLEEHAELLELLNETVGGSAGSSEKENLLPRIYKKWKAALPDLEDAPLFRVIGRKKEYDNGIARTYSFTEEEKDSWANLFEYKGSGEHVRLRFSVDKLGADLNDVVITYGEDLNLEGESAWDSFIDRLKKDVKEKQVGVQIPAEPRTAVYRLRKWENTSLRRWLKLAVAAAVLVAIIGIVWNFFIRELAPPVELASVERMAFPLPDKPSIAVLPFVNMSGDPKQEYFSDGITEEIITALSKCQWLFVIARSSTFTYKKKPVKVQQVAEELGVRYVLEGSVRKAVERVRITAQLSDAMTGYHLWAECYERDLKDIFALQDEITVKILTALKVRLTEGERAGLKGKGTESLEAYLRYLQGHEYFHRGTPEDYIVARRMAEEAIALDPNFSRPYLLLAWTHLMEGFVDPSKSLRKSTERAHRLAQKIFSMDDYDAYSHALLGFVYLYRNEHEKAVAVLQQAVELNPNSARVLMYLGWTLIWAERPQEAIPLLKEAMRLSPLDKQFQGICLYHLGRAYAFMGQYEEAIAELKKSLLITPNHWSTLLALTAVYIGAGREEDASATAKELLKICPKFSLEDFAKEAPYKDPAHKERAIYALRKAGLK